MYCAMLSTPVPVCTSSATGVVKMVTTGTRSRASRKEPSPPRVSSSLMVELVAATKL
jgi:hypothetical protein